MDIVEEARLFELKSGITFPLSLLRLYKDKGNGGFGPEFGFIGILSGHKTDMGDSILTLYQALRADNENDPNWKWPRSFVPFIHKGCGIHLCLDVSKNPETVIKFDPNNYDLDVGPEPHFEYVAESLEKWFSSYA